MLPDLHTGFSRGGSGMYLNGWQKREEKKEKEGKREREKENDKYFIYGWKFQNSSLGNRLRKIAGLSLKCQNKYFRLCWPHSVFIVFLSLCMFKTLNNPSTCKSCV